MAGSTREWVDFFQEAGIPSDEAASYALIFARNRIKKNMLIDLNKEYLKDMGITLLGDVIAILKHAKHVHESNSRASIMALPQPVVAGEKKFSKTHSHSHSGGNTTVKRLLDHYTKKYKEAEESLSATPKLPIKVEAASVTTSVSMKSLSSKVPLKDESASLSSRFDKKSSPPEKSIVRLKETPATQKLEVPLQKKWKVLPEHEGGYKITMPKKSARLSQTIKLEKSTVFARLGDGAVSSTTPDIASPKKTSLSIFARLGDVSSTSPAEEPSRKRRALPSSVSLRADEEIKAKHPAPKLIPKKDFHIARDLKMLKITTEFSDDDDVEAISAPASVVKAMPLSVQKSTVKRRADQAELEEEGSPLPPLPKRVRFGGTSTRLLTADSPVKVAAATVFKTHTVALKKIGPSGGKELTSMKRTPEASVKARVGVVRPRPATPISKMVSDTMAADSLKQSVKNRINLKGKSSKSSKGNILDRLG